MNIVYTGLFAYPDSNANSLRVKSVIGLLESYGHKVSEVVWWWGLADLKVNFNVKLLALSYTG